jgi:hypothetical protein
MAADETDFASAALRHIRDAERLIETGPHTSRDQAWHLAGFAHECARKAFIAARNSWVSRMLGHDFDDSGNLVMELAVALDPHAGRFPVNDWARRYPAITAWRPEHRYDRTGASVRDHDRRVEDLIAQGREAVDACMVALFMEGALAIESLQ